MASTSSFLRFSYLPWTTKSGLWKFFSLDQTFRFVSLRFVSLPRADKERERGDNNRFGSRSLTLVTVLFPLSRVNYRLITPARLATNYPERPGLESG